MAHIKPLRGAIVGFGQVAEHAHAPAFLRRRDFEIVAVAEENIQRRRRAEEVIPGVRVHENLDVLLASEKGLDFIDIATPPFLHARQAAAALEGGCHVLCEKPLTLDAAELTRLRELSAARGKTLFTVNNWKFAPLFLKLASLLEAGAVGKVSHAELHVLRQKPASSAASDWRTDPKAAGGGILVDHGWHNLYLLKSWIKEEPLRISSRMTPSSGPEEEAAVFFEFPSATAMLRLSWLSSYRANWGFICGSAGSIDIQDDALLLRRGPKEERFVFSEKLSQGSAHPEWFAAMLETFRGKAAEQNIEEALFCAETIARIYEAGRLVPA